MAVPWVPSAILSGLRCDASETCVLFFCVQLYREEELLEEKDRIALSLGAVRDEALQKRVLEFAISVRLSC